MNNQKEQKEKQLLLNLELPKIKQTETFKKRLREALLLAHQERSGVRAFGYIFEDIFETMSILKKSIILSSLTIAGLVVVAGILGPSAAAVANAQAQETINRAFIRLANLSDEERVNLEEKFQEKMLFKREMGGHFIALKDMAPEDLEAWQEQRQESLMEALAEAQAAPDLQIISAEEMPISGFLGRAGRAFGLKMMHRSEYSEERLAYLPEDVKQTIQEHHAEMSPVSFMVYTNSDGQIVHLGLNESNEPVMKCVQPKEGEFSFPPQHGRRMIIKSE